MKKLALFVLLFACMVVPNLPAFAQAKAGEGVEEKGLEYLLFEEIPTVSSVGFFKTKATLAPGYSIVVTSDQVDMSPARTLMDIVEYWDPAVQIQTHTMAGPLIWTRGVGTDSNGKTMIMLDGQDLNHRQHFGYSNEMKVPLLGDIARYEIINGPGAILWGSGAINGFVNMIPKNGKDYKGFIDLADGFADGMYKAEAGYGYAWGQNNDIFLYGGYMEAQGAKVKKIWGGGREVAFIENSKQQAFRDPTYKISAYLRMGDFSLNTFLRNEVVSVNGDAYNNSDPYMGERPLWETASLGFRPKYDWKLTDQETLIVEGSVMLMEMGQQADTAEPIPGNPKGYAWDNCAGNTERHFDLKLTGKTTRFTNHSLAFGMSMGYKGFNEDDSYTGNEVNPDSLEGTNGAWREVAYFAEDVWQIFPKLTGSFGFREDQFFYSPIKHAGAPTYDPPNLSHFSKRGALAFEITDKQVIKLSYQEGFRNPDMADYQYYGDLNQRLKLASTLAGTNYPLLKQLQPETMKSTELNYHIAVDQLRMQFDANGYYNSYTNMIHWNDFGSNSAGLDPTSVEYIIGWRTTNPHFPTGYVWQDAISKGWAGSAYNAQGTFRSCGLELIGKWNPIESTEIMLSYAYSRPLEVDDNVYNQIDLFTTTRSAWDYYPSNMIKGAVTNHWFNDKLITSINGLYQSGLSEKQRYAQNEVFYKSRFNLNLAITYKITKNLSAKLTIENWLYNHTPHTAGNVYTGNAMDCHRYWYLSANYKF